jgi:peroxiredoxin
LPSLERLHRHFKGEGFVLLNVDVGERSEWVKRFAEENDLSFPVLLDVDSEVASLYGVRAHPLAFLVDTEGYIAGIAHGYRNWDRDEMKALVGSMLVR